MPTLQQREEWETRFERTFPHLTQTIYVSLFRSLKKFIKEEIEKARYERGYVQEQKQEALLAQQKEQIAEETNVTLLIEKMKEEIQEHGDMHGEFCPCNAEDPDECTCEEMAFWGSQIEKYMREVDQWWIMHAKEHRKLCTPEGNKMLTKMMGKKNRIKDILSPTNPKE